MKKEIATRALALAKDADEFQVTDLASFEAAGHALKLIKEFRAMVNAEYAESIKSAKKTLDTVRSRKAHHLQPAIEAEKKIRERMGHWLLSYEAAAGQRPKAEGVRTKTVYKFRVTDPAAVPNLFRVIDEKELARLADLSMGEAKVPGIEFYIERKIK